MIKTTLLAASIFVTKDLDKAKDLSRYYQMPIVLFAEDASLDFESKEFIFVQVEGVEGFTIVNPSGKVVAQADCGQGAYELKKLYSGSVESSDKKMICYE